MMQLVNADGTLIGGLSEVLTAVVTEERNGIFELTMTYPASGELMQYIHVGTLIKAKPRAGADDDLFRIYAISKPINGRITINAEHISYQLAHIPVGRFTTTGVQNALDRLVSNSTETNPFTVYTDISNTQSRFKVDVPTSFRKLLGGVSGSILDVFGGELLFKGHRVSLLAHRGQDRGVVLRYGKNITDFKQEENITNVKTGLYPYYKTDDAYVELPEKVISVTSADSYPYHRTEVHDFTGDFSEPPSVESLRSKAQSYMTANNFGVPDVSITISFVDLSKTENYKDIAYLEQVNLCDTVKVIFEPYGVEATSKVVKVEYNVLTDRYDSITLGSTRTNLEKTMVQTQNNVNEIERVAQSNLEAAILRATELITGARGGFVKFVYDANENPQEILIMDTPDIATAQKIWRWNMAGLGYSSTGYNGQFTTAITADGEIVADFITTGTMSAERIRAGAFNITGGQIQIEAIEDDQSHQDDSYLSMKTTVVSGLFREMFLNYYRLFFKESVAVTNPFLRGAGTSTTHTLNLYANGLRYYNFNPYETGLFALMLGKNGFICESLNLIGETAADGTTIFQLNSGWSINANSSQLFRMGSLVYLNVEVTYTGTMSANGRQIAHDIRPAAKGTVALSIREIEPNNNYRYAVLGVAISGGSLTMYNSVSMTNPTFRISGIYWSDYE